VDSVRGVAPRWRLAPPVGAVAVDTDGGVAGTTFAGGGTRPLHRQRQQPRVHPGGEAGSRRPLVRLQLRHRESPGDSGGATRQVCVCLIVIFNFNTLLLLFFNSLNNK
jgi:hypothetical protein